MRFKIKGKISTWEWGDVYSFNIFFLFLGDRANPWQNQTTEIVITKQQYEKVKFESTLFR